MFLSLKKNKDNWSFVSCKVLQWYNFIILLSFNNFVTILFLLIMEEHNWMCIKLHEGDQRRHGSTVIIKHGAWMWNRNVRRFVPCCRYSFTCTSLEHAADCAPLKYKLFFAASGTSAPKSHRVFTSTPSGGEKTNSQRCVDFPGDVRLTENSCL